jgi:Barrel-sandwich domain of CusB or HlyD membrane-fusion
VNERRFVPTAARANLDVASEGDDKVAPPREPDAFLSSAWTALREDVDDASFVGAWLNIVRTVIPGLTVARIQLEGTPVFSWTANSAQDAAPALEPLAALADVAVRQGKPVLRGSSGERSLLACPVVLTGAPCGCCVVEVTARSEQGLREAMSALLWACAWLRDRVRQRRVEKASAETQRTGHALEVLAAALDQNRFVKAATAAVTELATRLQCDRVSLGFTKGHSIELVAVSHSASTDRTASLSQRLEAAMLEAVEQRTSLIYPPIDEDAVYACQAHAALSQQNWGETVLTVPLFLHDRFVGAILAERPAQRPFDQATLDVFAASSAALAPILVEKRLNDRALFFKIIAAIHEQAKQLFGPARYGQKLALIGLILVVLAINGVFATYYVDANARVEGRVERALVAPFDGFVRSARLRAGDVAQEGEVLATLDDRDLWLQHSSLSAERQQRRLEYDRALGSRDRAEANIAQAQIEKAGAQIALLDEKLGRAKIIAPFTGVIVEGDLSRGVGGPVHAGDTLFRIAPLNDYRVTLSVDEGQLADIAVGQTGRLLTTSLPDRPFPIRIERITPVAEARDGHTTFRVEAGVEGVEGLRPGMEGVAKVDAGRRRLAWIWTRSLADWLVLHTWAWWP